MLPWGLLTDRWGDRPVLLTGLVSNALALQALLLPAVALQHGFAATYSLLAVLCLMAALLTWDGPAAQPLGLSARL
jgi:MFS family permease